MSRRTGFKEVNSFVAGIITEASPLTFPAGATVNEDNCVLNINGSRRRRLGMDFEDGFANISTGVTVPTVGEVAFNSFVWENAGGVASKTIIVVQVGKEIRFFHGEEFPLSANLISSNTVGTNDQIPFSFAVVDSVLVVASGKRLVDTFTYTDPTIVQESFNLKIRDLFGVESVLNGVDLRADNNVGTRPSDMHTTHLYNLRNQSFGVPRPIANDETLEDPISAFTFEASVTEPPLIRGFVYRDQASSQYRVAVSFTGENFLFTKEREPSAQDGGPLPGVTYVEDFPAGVYMVLEDGDLDYRDTPPETSDPDRTEPIAAGDDMLLSGGFWSLNTVGSELPESSFPSMADIVNGNLFADATDGDNRNLKRFWPENLIKDPLGNVHAPNGHFIINALDRGASRREAIRDMHDKYPGLTYQITEAQIPTDQTSGGATAIAEYASRVFYAGFPSEITGEDSHSPKLASYVLFSQVVNDSSDVNKCYQDGDPTSTDEPDLIATDGGFIRIDGAYDIQQLIVLGDKLLLGAANGVWSIEGGSGYGFTATDYKVTKITDHGYISSRSAVKVDNSILYWSDDGIYSISGDEVGVLTPKNLTVNTIQTLYDSISDDDKLFVQGEYDQYDKTVRWVYGNRVGGTTSTKEIILNIVLGSFYTSTISKLGGANYPKAITLFNTKPFKIDRDGAAVVVNGDQVVVNGQPVGTGTSVKVGATREMAYVTITGVSPFIQFTFSLYKDDGYLDWKTSNGLGVDAPAYMITGWDGEADYQRFKQTGYLTMHMLRTEDTSGFDSSVMVQAQWEWSNSAASNRWGVPFEAYRYNPNHTGFTTVVSKSRLRGKGKVLSLYMYSSPGKAFNPIGWGTIVSMDGNV